MQLTMKSFTQGFFTVLIALYRIVSNTFCPGHGKAILTKLSGYDVGYGPNKSNLIISRRWHT